MSGQVVGESDQKPSLFHTSYGLKTIIYSLLLPLWTGWQQRDCKFPPNWNSDNTKSMTTSVQILCFPQIIKTKEDFEISYPASQSQCAMRISPLFLQISHGRWESCVSAWPGLTSAFKRTTFVLGCTSRLNTHPTFLETKYSCASRLLYALSFAAVNGPGLSIRYT